jgi:hypothetical protein
VRTVVFGSLSFHLELSAADEDGEVASWVPKIKRSEAPAEEEKQKSTTKVGIKVRKSESLGRPFKELFDEHLNGVATVKLVNKRKRCATVDISSTAINVRPAFETGRRAKMCFI